MCLEKCANIERNVINPFRNIEEYPPIREKIDRHKERIRQDRLWKGALVAREKPGEEGTFELAFGLHRLCAMIELNEEFPDSGYGEISLSIENMDDETMQNRMIRENEESTLDKYDTVKHRNLSVETVKNLIERGVLIGKGTQLTVQDLGIERINGETPSVHMVNRTGFSPIPPEGMDLPSVQNAMERFYIQEALKLAGGNESKAARMLNINHHTFRYHRKKLQTK